MATNQFSQPPDNDTDLVHWRKNIQESLFGEAGSGGKLNGNNIINITDPGDADGTLADITTKFNNLLAELRTLGIIKER